MSDTKTLREHSTAQYSSVSVSIEELNAGSLQRIADATEAMAKNYVKLQNDYHYMRMSRDGYRASYEQSQKRISVLKGQITRLKNQLKKQAQ